MLALAFTPYVVVAQRGPVRPISAPSQRPDVFGNESEVVNTDLVTLVVTVTDTQGHHVVGLEKSAFTIYDNKTRREISFFDDADEPLSVAVVFDVSGSMTEGKITRAKEALGSFIQTSHPQDEFYLIDFSSTARVLLEKTRDADAVAAKLTYIQPQGNTALCDAVYLGIDRLERGAPKKRVLLLISDGEDNNSRYSFAEIRRRLEESDVSIYSIGINVGPERVSNGEDTLRKLAATSGGKAFFPGNAIEMNDAFEKIAVELRHQYSISFRPSDFVNRREWHSLKVSAGPLSGGSRLFVRTRRGYYTFPREPRFSMQVSNPQE